MVVYDYKKNEIFKVFINGEYEEFIILGEKGQYAADPEDFEYLLLNYVESMENGDLILLEDTCPEEGIENYIS